MGTVKIKKVALMFPVARVHEGETLRGVLHYASRCGTWTINANPEMSAISLRGLAG